MLGRALRPNLEAPPLTVSNLRELRKQTMLGRALRLITERICLDEFNKFFLRKQTMLGRALRRRSGRRQRGPG